MISYRSPVAGGIARRSVGAEVAGGKNAAMLISEHPHPFYPFSWFEPLTHWFSTVNASLWLLPLCSLSVS